ncbi:MAG: methyltransferase domain-containing protein [Ignavibacteria bacterium]|nr:methyltransferase domain-containing protein [Ignavibacteria bacterium]
MPSFDELPLWSAPFGLRLLDAAMQEHATRILDVGCGSGFPLVELAERFGRATVAIGVDPWRDALGWTMEKIRYTEAHGASVAGGVCERLPFRAASFDLIVSNNGLNNVADLAASLRECARVAVPGCRIHFTMNTDGSFREFYGMLGIVLRERGLRECVEAMERHIALKRPPVRQVCALFRDAGFTDVRMNEDEFAMRYASGTAFFAHHFIRLAFLPSWRALLPEAEADEILAEMEKRLNVASEEGPLTMTIPFVLISAKRE